MNTDYEPWIKGDRDFCDAHDIDYQPCIFPGTSFHNSNGSPKNLIPRQHGDFMWFQFATLRSLDVKSVYVAMFDELNEATDPKNLAKLLSAVGGNTNKIAWQKKTPYRLGGGSGSTTTAGGIVLRGDPGGEILAHDAKTGEQLWKFQTGFGADAPPVVYEVDGVEYIAIFTGGNSIQQSATGDAVWAFSLRGELGPAWWPPTPPPTNAGLGLYWRLRSALLSLWEGGGYHKRIGEPSGQGAHGDRGDR